jgi:hypothetical protein
MVNFGGQLGLHALTLSNRRAKLIRRAAGANRVGFHTNVWFATVRFRPRRAHSESFRTEYRPVNGTCSRSGALNLGVSELSQARVAESTGRGNDVLSARAWRHSHGTVHA